MTPEKQRTAKRCGEETAGIPRKEHTLTCNLEIGHKGKHLAQGCYQWPNSRTKGLWQSEQEGKTE